MNRLFVFNTLGENVSAQTDTQNTGKKMVKPPSVGSRCRYLCSRTSWSFFFNAE